MVHSICDSYPKFGAATPRQTGVITRRKKWGRLTPPPPPPSKCRVNEGRAPEQDVARGVRLLTAHGAPARRAADVGELRQLVLTLFWAVRLLPVSLDIG